jgi:holo-[acyl-carrier protein] synthase
VTGTRVGIDIVPLARVRAMLESAPQVLRRHFTEAELADGGADVAGLAGRLAAKEAVFKTIRSPGAVLPWLGIQIHTEAGGWPVAALSGRAATLAAAAGFLDVDISISHDGDYAIAAAVVTTTTPPPPTEGKAE